MFLFKLTVLAYLCIQLALCRISVGPPSTNTHVVTLTFYYKRGFEVDESILQAIENAHSDYSIHVVPCHSYPTICSELPHPERGIHVMLTDEYGQSAYPGILSEHEILDWLRIDYHPPQHINQNPGTWSDLLSTHPGSHILLRLYDHKVSHPDRSFLRLAAKLRTHGVPSAWGNLDEARDLIHASMDCVTTPGLWLVGKTCAKFDRRPAQRTEEDINENEASIETGFPLDETYKWSLRHLKRVQQIDTIDVAQKFLEGDKKEKLVIMYGVDDNTVHRVDHSLRTRVDANVVSITNKDSAELIHKEYFGGNMDEKKWILILDPFASAKYCIEEGSPYVSEPTLARKHPRDAKISGETNFTTERVYLQVLACLSGRQSSQADFWDYNMPEEEPLDKVGGHVDYDLFIEEEHGRNVSTEDEAPFKVGGKVKEEKMSPTTAIYHTVMLGVGFVKNVWTKIVRGIEGITGTTLDKATQGILLFCIVGIVIVLTTTICIPRPRNAVKTE